MAVEIITPHFECVVELKKLLRYLGEHPSLSVAAGPKYLTFSTYNMLGRVTLDCDLELESICAQICGHLLTLADMDYPLVEAAKMEFLVNTAGTSITLSRSMNAKGELEYHIEIIAPRVKLIFKELGPEDGRYCELVFIRF